MLAGTSLQRRARLSPTAPALGDPTAAAYADLAARLGPLVVVGAGGVLVELLADRAVALPPVSAKLAADMVTGLRVSKLLAGVSGARPADLDAVTRAIAEVSELAVELGEHIEVLDVNPLIRGPDGAVAVDAGSSAPNDPSCQLIAPAGSSA